MLLHQRTQIALCRAGFVLLCLAPTLGVIAWAVWLPQPARLRRIEREFAARYGVKLRLANLVHPQRGRVRIDALELHDPLTGKLLASAADVEIAQAPSGAKIVARQARVDQAARDAIAGFVSRRFRRADAVSGSVWILIDELTWQMDKHQWRLPQFKAGVELADESDQAFLGYQGERTGPRMRVMRGGDPKLAPYEVQIHTGSSALPCRWFEALGIDTRWLGAEAAFQGSAWSHWVEGHWLTQVIGRVSQVDLAALLGDDSPHCLTGTAEMAITPKTAVRLRGTRLERLSATITAGPGQISSSLLAAARQSLEMPSIAAPAGQPKQQLEPYQQMAFDVRLDAGGLVIAGRCDQGGTVLCDDKGAMLTQPRRPQSVAQLVEMLAGPSNSVIPATREGQRLAQHLPIPRRRDSPQAERLGAHSTRSAPPR